MSKINLPCILSLKENSNNTAVTLTMNDII